MPVGDMLARPFYYPVLEEGLRGALRDLSNAVVRVGGSSDLSGRENIGHDALD